MSLNRSLATALALTALVPLAACGSSLNAVRHGGMQESSGDAMMQGTREGGCSRVDSRPTPSRGQALRGNDAGTLFIG